MRCSHCGATNPDTAAWCGQCHRRFDELPVRPEPVRRPASDPLPAPVPPAAEGFRREGGELQWRCPSCEHYNPIDAQGCARCGTTLMERFRSQQPQPRRNWTRALAISAVAPGGGHIALDHHATGVARLVLFVSWVLGAVLLAREAGERAAVVASPLALGSLVVWAASLADIYRLQRGAPELLAGRRMLWLVVAVMVALGVALLTSLTASAPP